MDKMKRLDAKPRLYHDSETLNGQPASTKEIKGVTKKRKRKDSWTELDEGNKGVM